MAHTGDDAARAEAKRAAHLFVILSGSDLGWLRLTTNDKTTILRALDTAAAREEAKSVSLERAARAICAVTGEDPDMMVMPSITMPDGYTKPAGPPRPWWTFKADELNH